MARTDPGHDRPSEYRLFGAFRFLLATMVVAQHASSLLPVVVSRAIGPLEIGGTAVYAFFIVSGFVISEAASATYRSRPAAFLLNRVLRLYPTYLVALLASALVMSAAAARFVPGMGESPITPERFASPTVLANAMALFPFWKAVQNHLGVPEILEQGWALRVEFLYYAFMAVALFIGVRSRAGLAPVLAVSGLSLLVVVALAWRQVGGSAFENVPYFVFGTALFFMSAKRGASPVAAGIALGAIGMILLHLLGRPATFGDSHFARDRWGELALLTILVSLMLTLSRVSVRSRRLIRTDRWLGDLTYPLYLMHWAVLIAAKTWMPHASLLTTLIAFAGCCAVSWASVVGIERPIGLLRARLRRGLPSQPSRTFEPVSAVPS